MTRASIEEYVSNPVGRYVAGRSFVIWVHSPTLAGAALVGRLDEAELPAIARLTTLPETWASDDGYDVLVDFGGMDAIDSSSFAAFLQHVQATIAANAKVRRIALVRPQGMPGAVVCGVFHNDIPAEQRIALFADRADAWSWLEGGTNGDARPAIQAVMASLVEEPPLLHTLREYLRDHANPTLAAAAIALRLSERSLSRRLNELGTSFRDEVQRARMHAAESLLVDTDLKLDVVAHRLGFRSRAHFSGLFRRVTGETPGEFRARRR